MTHLRAARVASAPLALVAALIAGSAVLAGWGGVASAHTLDSSAVKLVIGEDSLTGTVSVAVASLDKALAPDQRSAALSPERYASVVEAYIDDHLSFQGADGMPWDESYSNLVRQSTEGVETVTMTVSADAGGNNPADVAVSYDAIIEAVPDHEAVLVVETAGGEISTPGLFSTDKPVIVLGEGSTQVASLDMVRLGVHHVLDGADHLLFLFMLLLPAPLIAVAGRWRRGPGPRASVRKVVHVVTAFTIGHSLTLLGTALGWIEFPSRPVEVLIALSVGVSAIHAMRPLVRFGEPVIAGGFGLIHGMAFAGILADLGLEGRASVLGLLGFNVGIELAQLAVAFCVFPSLLVMSTRRAYSTARIGGASIGLAASVGWLGERLGLASNPLAGAEAAVIEHKPVVVVALAVLAAVMFLFGRPDERSDDFVDLQDPGVPDDPGVPEDLAPPVAVAAAE